MYFYYFSSLLFKKVFIVEEEIDKTEIVKNHNTLYIFEFDRTLFDLFSIRSNLHEIKKEVTKKLPKIEDSEFTFEKRFLGLNKEPFSGPGTNKMIKIIKSREKHKLAYKKLTMTNTDTLKELLQNIKVDKWVLSNNVSCVVEDLLTRSDLFCEFSLLLGRLFNSHRFMSKEEIQVYEKLDSLAKSLEYKKVYFFDNMSVFVNMGKIIGWESYHTCYETIEQDVKDVYFKMPDEFKSPIVIVDPVEISPGGCSIS